MQETVVWTKIGIQFFISTRIRHVVSICTFHKLLAIAVRDDLHSFAQKPNVVVYSIMVGTYNNTIYIVLLLLLSPWSCTQDIYGILRLGDTIPTTFYIILFCCAVISLAIGPCRCCTAGAIGTYYLYNDRLT